MFICQNARNWLGGLSISEYTPLTAAGFFDPHVSNDAVEEGFLGDGLDDTCRAWHVSGIIHLVHTW